MKTNTKLILGILTAVSMIAFIVLWDLVIKENIDSEEVVIIKPGVVLHAHEEIREENLYVEKRNRATLVEGYIKPEDMLSVVGKQANQTLVGNQIVSTRYLDMEDIVPDPEKGEAIRPIPNQWIYAIPATVRRKDKIDVYLVQSEEMKKKMQEHKDEPTNQPGALTTEPSYVGLSPEQEMALENQTKTEAAEDEKFSEQRQTIASKVTTETVQVKETKGEPQEILDFKGERDAWLQDKGLTANEWNALIQNGDMPVLVDVPVAYAKDGAGNEILNNPTATTEKEKPSERLTATGEIVNLELLLSEENHRLLLGFINKGYQIYVTYN